MTIENDLIAQLLPADLIGDLDRWIATQERAVSRKDALAVVLAAGLARDPTLPPETPAEVLRRELIETGRRITADAQRDAGNLDAMLQGSPDELRAAARRNAADPTRTPDATHAALVMSEAADAKDMQEATSKSKH